MPWIQFSLAIILSSSDFQVKTPTSYPGPRSPSPSTSQALSLPHSWVWKLHLSSPSCNAHQSRPHTCVPPHSQHPCQYHKELEPKLPRCVLPAVLLCGQFNLQHSALQRAFLGSHDPPCSPAIHYTSHLLSPFAWGDAAERRGEERPKKMKKSASSRGWPFLLVSLLEMSPYTVAGRLQKYHISGFCLPK